MASEMLERDDLSIYVVAGVPKSFKKKLQKFVDAESKTLGEVMLLDDELTEWVVTRLKGQKRRSHETTPASSALWRSYEALSAARYHLQDQPLEARVREVRDLIEELWRGTSPLFNKEEESEEGTEEGSESDGASTSSDEKSTDSGAANTDTDKTNADKNEGTAT